MFAKLQKIPNNPQTKNPLKTQENLILKKPKSLSNCSQSKFLRSS